MGKIGGLHYTLLLSYTACYRGDSNVLFYEVEKRRGGGKVRPKNKCSEKAYI